MAHRIALYAGSFDPYTNGHHDIVRKASQLFDEVVVMIAVNLEKRRTFDADAMRKAIQHTLADDGLNARAVLFHGLVADYCREQGIRWYVRGVRNNMDYNYEENIAQINHLINPELESIYLRSDEPALSSSMIRELIAFGRNVDGYLPGAVAQLIHP
ncbi:MAG: pantetheine-phosphate adenylyltransferase [Clostridia bacterium]|nr:pantetheine-phosphate adenylyltransferase [Clostridia bacterium]